MIELTQPRPEDVLQARLAAQHSQEEAAATVGLGGGIRWSEYERGVRSIDPVRFALYQLMTNQHPEWRLSRRKLKA